MSGCPSVLTHPTVLPHAPRSLTFPSSPLCPTIPLYSPPCPPVPETLQFPLRLPIPPPSPIPHDLRTAVPLQPAGRRLTPCPNGTSATSHHQAARSLFTHGGAGGAARRYRPGSGSARFASAFRTGAGGTSASGSRRRCAGVGVRAVRHHEPTEGGGRAAAQRRAQALR